MLARTEDLGVRCVPEGIRFLVAAVDVQGGKKRRFVVQVTGYGEKGKRWIVDRFEITQSLRTDERGECVRIHPGSYREDWKLLISDVLEKTYPLRAHPAIRMSIMALGIDSGGEPGVTDNAYSFWRQCRREGLSRKVFLFKGGSRRGGSKLITKSYPDNTGRSDRHAKATGDVPLYLLQTDNLKDRIAAVLSRDTPGPNYVHFPDWLDDSFYDELTYEERGINGKWEPPGRGANEAFDLMVYTHALVILKGYEKIKWEKPPPWARLPDLPPENTTSPADTTIISSTVPAKPEKPKKRKAASAWVPVSPSGGGWI